MAYPFQAKDLILFQGDSITDCSRARDYPQSLGNGYVDFVAVHLWAAYPRLQLNFRNEGIAGDTTADLLARWQTDTIDLQPNWLSLLVGMNDVLQGVEPAQFDKNYRELIKWTQADTKAQIVMMGSFAFPSSEESIKARPALDEIIQRTRAIAYDYGIPYIDLDGIFSSVVIGTPWDFWTTDGIHPLQSGHGVITNHWLETMARW